MSFIAQEESVRSLLNRKVFCIPRNQRQYVWNKNNWEELFDDVRLVVEKKSPSHFIGSIVLKKDPEIAGLPQYSVIDGQQRTITIAIFMASIMFWMKKNGMNNEFNGMKPYLIAKDENATDIVMVTSENNGSLESIIRAITDLTEESARKKTYTSIVDENVLNKGDKNIGDAFKFFLSKLNEYIGIEGASSESLIAFRNALRDITFVNITATTEEDSYTIFEILNARGLELEDHELLKNYIMRYIQPEGNRDKAKAEWKKIEEMLGNTNLKRFVRHYTIHRYGDYITKTDASDYKTIRDRNKGLSTWELLLDIEKKATYYLKLVTPCKSGEGKNCSEAEFRVYSFFKKRRQEQMRPLLLSLITKHVDGSITDRQYEELIEFLYNFFICYSIIGEENSNKLTNIVTKYSAKLCRDCTESNINEFVRELRSKLPSEEMFINYFKNIGWSHQLSIYEGEKNKTRVQIVLEVLERYKNHGICDNDFTIEHVKPDSEDVSNGQIGNLIPLESALNEKCKTKPLSEKMDFYYRSTYAVTRNFYDRYKDKDFDPNKRTEILAKEFYNRILNLNK